MINGVSPVPRFKNLVGSDSDQAYSSYFLSKFKLYQTKARFYVIGTDKSRTLWRVLKIDRTSTGELDVFEDPAIYSQHDCNDLLSRLDAGNQSTGGLKFVTKAYGIIGFIKLLEPYYMLIVTKRKLLGNISGHSVYGIKDSKLLLIPHPAFQTNVADSQAEHRYKKLFNSVNLKGDFFFSYTYKIMCRLQTNIEDKAEKMPYEDMFVWNSFLTSEFRQRVKCLRWTVALVHGYFKQMTLSAIGVNVYKVTLIARRSRHFAGTRYLKRGVNDKGRVANDVETEQLLHEETGDGLGQISSVVQHRGSIPLFWSQDTSILSPRPDIKLQKYDFTYSATKLHFQNLVARYGNPIIVLNLVKTMEKKPRETVLCHEFANAVAYLNHSLPKEHHIKFIQWDFHRFAKSASTNVLDVLGTITTDALNRVGFYYSGKGTLRPNDTGLLSKELESSDKELLKEQANSEKIRRNKSLQHGVLRTNCIDCLDRTNVAQYAFGLAALGQQMYALGLSDEAQVAPDSHSGSLLMDMYEKMGDALALQYGGSPAHNTVLSNRQGKWKAATQSLDLLRAIQRHYSNAYTDGLKQDAINIFLGHYRPDLGKPPLWQLDSDNHLQIRREEYGPFTNHKISIKRSLSAGSVVDQRSTSSVDFRLKHPVLHELSPDKSKNTTEGSSARVKEEVELSAVASDVSQDGKVKTLNFRNSLTPLNISSHHERIFLPITLEEGEEEEDEPCSSQYSEDSTEDHLGQPAMYLATAVLQDKSGVDTVTVKKHAFSSAREVLRDAGAELNTASLRKRHSFEYSDDFLNWIHSSHTFFQSFCYQRGFLLLA